MSVLPAGTLAAESFAQDVAEAGLKAAAYAYAPGLFSIPIIGTLVWNFLDKLLTAVVLNNVFKLGNSYALAAAFTSDRIAFDNKFVYLKVLDAQNPTQQQIIDALNAADAALEKFVHRGPIT